MNDDEHEARSHPGAEAPRAGEPGGRADSTGADPTATTTATGGATRIDASAVSATTTTTTVGQWPSVHVAVRDEPLSLDAVSAFVARPSVGGVVTFTGIVRDADGGRGVAALDYSAHPLALDRLRDLVAEVAGRDGVVAVAAEHRTGHLGVGDVAVALAVGARHRAEAFDGCRELIDRLKREVPIWKHQVFDDGTDEWVGTP